MPVKTIQNTSANIKADCRKSVFQCNTIATIIKAINEQLQVQNHEAYVCAASGAIAAAVAAAAAAHAYRRALEHPHHCSMALAQMA